MKPSDISGTRIPQLPAICIRGWVIEPLATLDELKVCGKDDWKKPEFRRLRIYDRTLSTWRLLNVRHVGHPGPFRGFSLLRRRAYLIDFDVEFEGEISLSALITEIMAAINRRRLFYDSIIGFDEFEEQLPSTTTFDDLYDQVVSILCGDAEQSAPPNSR